MIVTVTLNPCLHKMIVFRSQARREKVVKPVLSWYQAGGKGINVARAASRFGARVVSVTTRGGLTGDLFEQLLAQESFASRLVRVAAPTRMSTSLFEEDSRAFTEYLEAGGQVGAPEAEALFDETLRAVGSAKYVALSGSSPDANLDDFFLRLIERLGTRAYVAVDTYGAPARRLLEVAPALFKANHDELHSTFELDETQGAVDRFARERLDVGCQYVLISGGEAGATLYGREGVIDLESPQVQELNPVGSGDAMLGALLCGLDRGAAMIEACRLGTAAGAANAARVGVCDFEPVEVEKLLPRVRCRERAWKV
jgi:1-phosphofructokinase family hexose kinase